MTRQPAMTRFSRLIIAAVLLLPTLAAAAPLISNSDFTRRSPADTRLPESWTTPADSLWRVTDADGHGDQHSLGHASPAALPTLPVTQALTLPAKTQLVLAGALKAEVAVSTPAGQSLSHARLYLPRNDVGCIVRLPRRLQQFSRREQTLTVEVNRLPGACQLALADAQGRLLYTQPARTGLNTLPLNQLTVSGQPACIKLLAGQTLVDVGALPAP